MSAEELKRERESACTEKNWRVERERERERELREREREREKAMGSLVV